LKFLIGDEKAHIFDNFEINAFTWNNRIIYVDEAKRKQKNDHDQVKINTRTSTLASRKRVQDNLNENIANEN